MHRALALWIAVATCAACIDASESSPVPQAGFGGDGALGATGGSGASGLSAMGGQELRGGAAGSGGGGAGGGGAGGGGAGAGGAGAGGAGGSAGAAPLAGTGGVGMLAGTGGDEAGGAAGSAAGSGPDACDVDVTLTVTTFNIRYDSGSGSGEDAWNASVNPRRERVLATITASSSDVVGVQEALANQVDDLTSSLDDFDFFGVGRDDGMRAGEFSGIFYRRARLERIDGGHFWLSETPEVPGTVFSGSGSIRMASWLVLRDRVTTRDFLLLNTHWDNVSQTSREQSALLIRERLSSLGAGLPEVLTGDLNQAESNVAVTTLTSPEPDGAGLIDAYRAVHRTRAPDERTFHDFTGETTGERIDFVLHSAGFVPLSAVIDRSQFDGRFASDHFAVTVTLGWAPDAARCDESADDSD